MIPSACVGDDLLLSKVVLLQGGVYTWLSVPGRGYIISGHRWKEQDIMWHLTGAYLSGVPCNSHYFK
jgi:hypothetical protein